MSIYTQKRFAKTHSHRYFIDAATNDAICLCGKVRGSAKAPKNKFHANTCFYNGYWYQSMFEANYAMQLDWRLKAGDIKAWDRQFTIAIRNPKTHELLRNHRVDFRIHNLDGSFELAETKGYEMSEWKAIKKEIEVLWLPEHLDYTYVVVK